MQGTADDTVQPAWSDAVVRSLCKNDNDVRYTIYPGATHETVVTQAAAEIAPWIDARFKEEVAQSNCAALPAAKASN